MAACEVNVCLGFSSTTLEVLNRPTGLGFSCLEVEKEKFCIVYKSFMFADSYVNVVVCVLFSWDNERFMRRVVV